MLIEPLLPDMPEAVFFLGLFNDWSYFFFFFFSIPFNLEAFSHYTGEWEKKDVE